MAWFVLLVLGFAFLLIKLGALSVWVSVLSLALKLGVFVFVLVGLGLVWACKKRMPR